MNVGFFIKRPVFASVCSLLILLAGLISFDRLAVREFPQIDPPVVSVSTTYPGASPQVVETEVTEVLEAELNGIDGVKLLTSNSRQAASGITVEFNLDRDLDTAAQEVRDRINRVLNDLPDTVEAPVVRKQSADSSAILWFALFSDTRSPEELGDYADRFVVEALESVPGVSSINIAGERRFAMRLWLDPQRMAARDISVLDIEQALQAANVELPSGLIENDRNEFTVRTRGRLLTPIDYEALVLRSNADGSQVRLVDVGCAEIGSEDYRARASFRGKPAVGLGVVRIADANTLEVAQAAKDKMAELAEAFPADLQYDISFDSSAFIAASIAGVWQSLAWAIALVVLVIFAFLYDWRATLIPAVTIPVSLIGVFALMNLLGFSINTLTLFALTLATGIVVDDTIVVLENIASRLQLQRGQRLAAATIATKEVVFAAIATTVVLVAVFLPVGFARGTTGQLFAEFAITLAGAVVISTFVALTLAPPMAARLLAAHPPRNRLARSVEGLLGLLRSAYGRSLEFALRHSWAIAAIFVASLWGTGWCFQQLDREFLPTEDRGAVVTLIRAPEGVSSAYTNRVIDRLEELYRPIPEVETFLAYSGFRGRVNSGIAFARLSDWKERRNPEQSQQAIVRQLLQDVREITDSRIIPTNRSSLRNVSGPSQAITLELLGNDLQELAATAATFALDAESLPEVTDLDSSFNFNKPELVVDVDRAQASRLGVSVSDIARTLQILLGGEDLTSFNQGNRRFDVIAQAEDRFRTSPEAIDAYSVRSQNGQLVPLGSVATVTPTTTPPSIAHYQRARSATVTASPAPGYTLGQAVTALEAYAREVLPPGGNFAFGGQAKELEESQQATNFLFGLALLFIFLVLAAQFESYLDPVSILLAVPLSLLGAFVALQATGISFNVYSQIGVVMLIGLATKNSILLVEFANQQRDRGLSPQEAILEAARSRLRPILMTAISTIVGLLPLAIATGAGAASQRSLGVVVLGGMAVSTLLSLYVVPVFYRFAARFTGPRSQESDTEPLLEAAADLGEQRALQETARGDR
ncbi:MAG: efflux RND transporter permease subunit [Cyanobacteria bacterium J06641_5]